MNQRRKQQIIERYCSNEMKDLKALSKQLLIKYGGLTQKDYDDFYSIANLTVWRAVESYDETRGIPFGCFLRSCLEKKFHTEMTARNRERRRADRNTISLDAPVGAEEGPSIGEVLPSDFDMERELDDRTSMQREGKAERYLRALPSLQREIVKKRAEGLPKREIRRQLKLSEKEYERNFQQLKSWRKVQFLLGADDESTHHREVRQVTITAKPSQTAEKSKPKNYQVYAIIQKLHNYTIRLDHPLQRESEQWSHVMKGNLISDILQDNPIPPLVFAEQVTDGIVIIWAIDGKQRCSNVESFRRNAFKISRNVERYLIKYQETVKDAHGTVILDDKGLPRYEAKVCDIRGKCYEDLPEKLRLDFEQYNFEVTQYLNCSDEDIEYHIRRYNASKPMTAAQKGITHIGERYAGLVKEITEMPFFRDMGSYRISEFNNGTMDRVITESIMVIYFLPDWKKKNEDICSYLKIHARAACFHEFKKLVGRLTAHVREDILDLFNSRDSFLWFGLYYRFSKTKTEDRVFMDFMKSFKETLHGQPVKGVTYDALSEKSTKDKSIVIQKLDILESLLNDFRRACQSGISYAAREEGR